jgi:hypothetical protein
MATEIEARSATGNRFSKGGRTQVFSVDQVERALRTTLGNVSMAAALLKCQRSTMYDYIGRYPDRLANIRARSRQEIADLAEGRLLLALKAGKEWAVRDALRLYGKHIGLSKDLDITSEGEAIAVGPTVGVTVTFVKSRFIDP